MISENPATFPERYLPRDVSAVEIDGDKIRIGGLDQWDGCELAPNDLRSTGSIRQLEDYRIGPVRTVITVLNVYVRVVIAIQAYLIDVRAF